MQNFIYLLSLGLEDSLGVMGLLTILMLFIYFSLFCYTIKSAIYVSVAFFAAIVLTIMALIFGFYDKYLVTPSGTTVARINLLVIGGMFVALGVVNLLDWLKTKKNVTLEKHWHKFPHVLYQGNSTARPQSRLRRAFILFLLTYAALFLGFTITLLSSLWMQDYRVTVSLFSLMLEGNQSAAIKDSLLYALGYIFPLICFDYFFIKIFFVEEGRQKIFRHISIYKIVVSALFLSTGAGLLWTFGQ